MVHGCGFRVGQGALGLDAALELLVQAFDAAYPLPESMRPYLERYCEDGTVPTLDQIQEEFGSP